MVRSVVRYAKLRGLLATFAVAERGGLRMEASGPLALFRHTLKYGHALAMFFPVLVSTPSFGLTPSVQSKATSATSSCAPATQYRARTQSRATPIARSSVPLCAMFGDSAPGR